MSSESAIDNVDYVGQNVHGSALLVEKERWPVMPSRQHVERMVDVMIGQITETHKLSDAELDEEFRKKIPFKVVGDVSREEKLLFVVKALLNEARKAMVNKDVEFSGLSPEHLAKGLVEHIKKTNLKSVPKGRLRRMFMEARNGNEADFEQALAVGDRMGLVKVGVTTEGTVIVEAL